MWEERTCRQVRQWQHWGSGCYEYACQNGRLHIIVIDLFFYLPTINPHFLDMPINIFVFLRWIIELSHVITLDRSYVSVYLARVGFMSARSLVQPARNFVK